MQLQDPQQKWALQLILWPGREVAQLQIPSGKAFHKETYTLRVLPFQVAMVDMSNS